MIFALLHLFVQISNSEIEVENLPSIERFSNNLKNQEMTILSSCPTRPSGSYVKTIIENDITVYSDSVVYGCNLHLRKQVLLNRCALQVYNSQFDSIIGSAIYLSLTATSIYNSNLKKVIEIFDCNFLNSNSENGAAIFINCTEVSKSITISACQFRGLTANQGGAIYYIYTYDSSISSINLIKDEHALLVQDSIFYNTTAKKLGGAICVISPKGNSNRPIEIKNCSFDSCKNSDTSVDCNGGAVYFSSSEVLRCFNVLHSNFTSCHSNSYGGSIYFNSVLGNIRDCTFVDNTAKKGGFDIFYEDGSTDSTTEKLAIFKNIFHHEKVDELNSQSSLIYLTFSDVSIFDFDTNQVFIKNTLTNVRVFGYDLNSATFKGKITIKNNCLSPPDKILYEERNVLESNINFYSAFSKQCELQECPSKPDNSVEISQSGVDESNKYLYACKKEFGKSEIKLTNCILEVFACTFSSTIKDHYPISIILNLNFQSVMNGTSKIRNCQFDECGSEAIYIESSVSTIGTEIVGCSFLRNKNGAIYFKSVFGLIQKCYFLDNSMNEMHRDIQYECSLDENSQEDGQKLTILDNTFNLTYNDNLDQNSGSFIFVYFNSKVNFEFNENKIIIDGSLDSADNLFVFDCPESSLLKGKWTVKDNCLSPPNDKFIKSGNIPDGFINDVDSAFKDTCLTNECPSMIEGSIVLWDGNYKETDSFEDKNIYLCGQYLDTHIQMVRCILKIYHCIFTDCRPESASRGGAIFISTDRSMSLNSNEVVEIYNCQFNGCEEDAGGAVYITSSESNRLFDFKGCKFDHNKAISSGSAPGSGGSIYINATKIHVENCVFSWNTAKNGASMYIKSNSPINDDQNIEIKSCTFEENEAEVDGGDVYYEFNSKKSTFYSLSKKLFDEEKFSFKIIDCTMKRCASAQNGASLSLNLGSEKTEKIVVKNCSFSDCFSLHYGGSIYIESDNYSTLFEINECVFDSCKAVSGSSIYFVCCNCHIKSCKFINNKASDDSTSVIYYNNNNYGYTSYDGSVIVDECKFEQTEEICSLFGYISREESVVNFTNNDVKIYNNKTVVFNTYYSTQGVWKFDGNSIIPPYDSSIKSKGSSTLSAACGKGFLCLVPTEIPTTNTTSSICNEEIRCVYKSDDSNPNFVVISLSSFNDLQITNENGAAVYLKNCGLKCDDSKFQNCVANSGGGGGIYVYINKEIQSSVNIERTAFNSCKAVFGGAVYIYCGFESTDILINNCDFISNKITQSENNGLSGGSSLYLTIKKGSVNNCYFMNSDSNGVKTTNNFDGLLEKLSSSSSSTSSSISFSNCRFEVNNESSCSFSYVRESTKEFFVNLKNCIFEGKLVKKAHHIEAEDLTKSSFSRNFVLEDCKFMTDKKSSIKKDSNIYILNIDEQVFNFNDGHQFLQNKINFKTNKVLLPILIISFIFSISVFLNLHKEKFNNNENDNFIVDSSSTDIM